MWIGKGMCPQPTQGGYTLIALLFVVAVSGAGLALLGEVWHTKAQREKEAELLFVGSQYRRAIISYYERSPGGVKSYPKRLKDLLEDPRFPAMRRHLRRLYSDPITGKPEWGLVKASDGGIRGIYSLSDEAPVKRANFSKTDLAFENKERYRDWVFEHVEPIARQPQIEAVPDPKKLQNR